MFTVGETAAGEDDGKVGIGVGVGVAHAAAEEDLSVVEEGAIAVLNRFQFFEEASELNHLVVLKF